MSKKSGSSATPTYRFGVARRLYATGQHPRLLLSPEDLPVLRKRVRGGLARRIMEGLRGRVRALVQWVQAAPDANAMLQPPLVTGHLGSHTTLTLDEIAFVAALDGDAEATAAVRAVFQALMTADPVSPPGAERSFAYGALHHQAVAYDLLAETLPAAERQAVITWLAARGVRDIVQRLRGGYLRHAGGNIALAGMTTAYLDALAIEGDPGAPDVAAVQQELRSWFEATLNTAFGPEGYPTEDIGYGTAVAAVVMPLVEALRRAGRFDAYEACPRLSRFGQAMLHFVQPWGCHLSNTGDGSDDFPDRQFVLARLATETHDPTLLWLLGTLRHPPVTIGPWAEYAGRYPEVPLRPGAQVPAGWFSLAIQDELGGARRPAAAVPTAFRDDGRGIVTFRSGWDDDATFVIFDGAHRSPSGQGHAHDSCGHFSLSALGEYFAIDTSRYCIEQDQHNVVLVDGQSGRSTNGDWRMTWYHGNLLACTPDPFCDFAAVDSSHQHNCYWARRFLGLVKGPGDLPAYVWTVEDVNKNNDFAEFWWTLNTAPGNTIEVAANHATIHGSRRQQCLDLFFALPEPIAYPQPHRIALEQDVVRCGSPNYIRDDELGSRLAQFAECLPEMVHGCVFQRPRFVAKVSGYNGRFMSLLIPRPHDTALPQVEQLPALDNSLAMRIRRGGIEDILIFAYEHQLLEAADIQGRGQWCVVRRQVADGKILSYALGDGLRLSVGGKRLVG